MPAAIYALIQDDLENKNVINRLNIPVVQNTTLTNDKTL